MRDPIFICIHQYFDVDILKNKILNVKGGAIEHAN